MDKNNSQREKISYSCSIAIVIIVLSSTSVILSSSHQQLSGLAAVDQTDTSNNNNTSNSKSSQGKNEYGIINKTSADYIDVLNGKAVALFYTGNFDEAIALSDEALAIDPNDLSALN